MSELMIRPIREEDVSQIHEIEKACFAMPWSEESILHDVKENVVARWLVLDDGEGNVLAYAGMWFVLDEAHVCNVAVRPDCRGKGYGKRIFQALIDLAMENSMATDHAGGSQEQHGCAESLSRLRHARRRISQAVL